MCQGRDQGARPVPQVHKAPAALLAQADQPGLVLRVLKVLPVLRDQAVPLDLQEQARLDLRDQLVPKDLPVPRALRGWVRPGLLVHRVLRDLPGQLVPKVAKAHLDRPDLKACRVLADPRVRRGFKVCLAPQDQPD